MIRKITKNDISQLLIIEEASHAVPWTADTFDTCFQAGYIGWLIEVDKKIIGFIMICLKNDECHILNLVVALAYQRQGWGGKLLEYALNFAKENHISVAYLEVRRSNSRAISLYKRMQFQLIGLRKGYYPTIAGNEDALVFAKSLKDNS